MAKEKVLYEMVKEYIDEEFEDLMDNQNCAVESFVESQTLADRINDRLDTIVDSAKKQLLIGVKDRFGAEVIYEKGNTGFHEAEILAKGILRSLIKTGIITDDYPNFTDIPISKIKETAKIIMENL